MAIVHTTSIFLGVILRDSHGVAQVKLITGNKILRILKAKGISSGRAKCLAVTFPH